MTAMSMPWSWGQRAGMPGRGACGPGDETAADRADEAGARRADGWRGPHGFHGGPGGRLQRMAAWAQGPRGGWPGGPVPPVPPGPPPPPGPHGAPWGGGPFPPGSGGPFGGGGHRRRGGPRARRGDVRTGILLLLAEEPRSGYEIIRDGRERSGNAWRPSSGSVYPMLQQLEDEGLVRPAEDAHGRRRPFELTDEGREYVEREAADLTPPWEAVSEQHEDAMARYAEISSLAYQLAAAAAQVAQAGTDEQAERAKRLLSETKRGLYRILAEDDGSSDDAPGDVGDPGGEELYRDGPGPRG
ncbi:PadR family transcriptional regulator [Streptomonospora wellingtoniae]|uniref:PadR family transcriptional regulator n=1 Tax=Streptomonospora wellingtoniae TaxID=3075544 RepID=A0ABU2KPI8_9ACTN|nr:PadR family transcriptional regulator [Streptomonospora sp. DSM 45055]MDT0301179.1 PadR family transcriptional regulator [Streptomonospora sp. DSM 45055]